MIDIQSLVVRHFDLAQTDFTRWLDLLDNDVVMEFPYGPSAGFPERMDGKEAIGKVIPAYFARVPGLAFLNRKIHPSADQDKAFATYDVDVEVVDTGCNYRQSYVAQFRARNGRIIRITEWFDTVKARAALMP